MNHKHIKQIIEEEIKEQNQLFEEAFNFFNKKENHTKRDDMNIELALKFKISNYTAINKWNTKILNYEQQNFIIEKYLVESIKKLNNMKLEKHKQKKEAWN